MAESLKSSRYYLLLTLVVMSTFLPLVIVLAKQQDDVFRPVIGGVEIGIKVPVENGYVYSSCATHRVYLYANCCKSYYCRKHPRSTIERW